MRLIIQRVTKAKVTSDGAVTGQINRGFLVLIGIGPNDTKQTADILSKKLCNLRIFEDENEKMNLSIKDINGKLLIVSQFTLYADCKKGNRPSFANAASPDIAEELYEYFMEKCKQEGVHVEKRKIRCSYGSRITKRWTSYYFARTINICY